MRQGQATISGLTARELSPALAWNGRGVCQQSDDPDLWFRDADRLEARAACIGTVDTDPCPMLRECAEWASREMLSDGVFGGLTKSQRDRIRRGKITVEDAWQFYWDAVAPPPPPEPEQVTLPGVEDHLPCLDELVAVIAAERGVDEPDVWAKSRCPDATAARDEVWAEAMEGGWTSTDLGRKFGRDHSTILAGAKRHRGRLAHAA